ncbi:hypothetical protein Lal_00015021 [Lupinus albus]|nr:hypothetical protein Lal_00015021 [Lupinus albus]
MSGALDPAIQREIVERDLYATAVLSGNRNFDGRIHPYAKQAFLASPALVVAYAIAGTIRFDIEKDVLGVDADGKPVRLADIWPGDAEIDAVVERAVKPQQFRKVYDIMFARRDTEAERVSPLYDWRPASTYIRRPPGAGGRAHAGGHAAAGRPRRQHHDGSPVAVERHHGGQRRGRVPREDGPAGRRLQFVRDAPRRPPDGAARHVREPDPEERDGAQPGRQRTRRFARAHRAGRHGNADVGSDRDVHGAQAAADRDRGRGLRPGLVARLGRERRAPRGRGSHRGRRLRAHPPHEPRRHGRAAAGIPAGDDAAYTGHRRHGDVRRGGRAHAARDAHARHPSQVGRDGRGARRLPARYGRGGVDLRSGRRAAAVCAGLPRVVESRGIKHTVALRGQGPVSRASRRRVQNRVRACAGTTG